MSYQIREKRTARGIKGKLKLPFLKGSAELEGEFAKSLTDSTGGVDGLAKRLLFLWDAHGLALSQVPRIHPSMCYTDTLNSEALLKVLTPELLDEVSKTFGVTTDWLEGTSKELYQTQWCYQAPENFFQFITENKGSLAKPFPFRLLSTESALDRKQSSHELALVAVHKKEISSDFVLQWYTVFGDSWIWSHPPSRLQLKAMARALWLTKMISTPIITSKRGTIEAVREGQMVPHEAMQSPMRREHLEDYALTRDDSLIAKETDEVDAVIALADTYKQYF